MTSRRSFLRSLALIPCAQAMQSSPVTQQSPVASKPSARRAPADGWTVIVRFVNGHIPVICFGTYSKKPWPAVGEWMPGCGGYFCVGKDKYAEGVYITDWTDFDDRIRDMGNRDLY